MPSFSYRTAVDHASRLGDAELIDFHRVVSRLARAAYGRQASYQRNYKNGMHAGRAKIEAARQRTSAARSASAGAEPAP